MTQPSFHACLYNISLSICIKVCALMRILTILSVHRVSMLVRIFGHAAQAASALILVKIFVKSNVEQRAQAATISRR